MTENSTIAAVPVPMAMGSMTDDQIRRNSEQAYFDRMAAKDDAARAIAPMVQLVAITGFIIHDNPDHIEGRTINRGDEFEVSEFDLPKFIGKGRLMSENYQSGGGAA